MRDLEQNALNLVSGVDGLPHTDDPVIMEA